MFGKLKFLTLFTFIFFNLYAAASFAADSAFTISGTVRDAKTSEPIIGAAVLLVDSYNGTVTDAEGKYTLTGVAPGKQNIEFTFISYKSVMKEVDVNGNVTGFDIVLEEDATQLEAVSVKAVMRSDTENSMVGTVKMAYQVVSGISAGQIAKSPDRTASEVIRRVPGITLIDDRFIIVRGLSQRYNNAWINGLPVPSTETDSRAFSFDLVPSSQIDNIMVYKSPSPEIPGDFAGGFVKITTKGIPDENKMEIGYQTGFNVNTQFKSFHINPGSGTDFLGFDANKRPLDKSFPAHMSEVTDPSEITRLTRSGFNNDWRIKSITPVPDQRLTFMIARRFNIKSGKLFGNITALNYSNTFKTTTGIKNSRYGIYDYQDDLPRYLNDYVDNQYSNDVRVGFMHNWSVMLNSSNRIEFKNLLNILGRNRLTERTGLSLNSGTYYQEQTEMLYNSRLTYNGQFSGTHDFRNGGTLTWDAGYSYANRSEPDRRISLYMAGMSSQTDPIPVDDLYLENLKRYFQTLKDHNVSVAANYRQPFRVGSITPTVRAGVYGEYRMRDYAPREFEYNYRQLPMSELSVFIKLPVVDMMQDQYLSADRVFIRERSEPKLSAYSADVKYGAVYGALDIPLGKLNIYAGVRLESHTTILKYDRAMSPTEHQPASNRAEDLNVLPSVNLTYKFNDKHQLRAAYGRSVNRPELRELSPSVYYDFDLFSEIGGNPDLKTAKIDNADLRYEFYPSFGETVSIGAFFKYFSNPIEWTFIDMGGTLRYNYKNAKEATNWGFELDVRKNLGFIGMRNFSLVLNAAWIESNVKFNPGELITDPDRPLQGLSPYIINTGLNYDSEKLGLSVTLLYNRIGKRIVGLGKTNEANPDLNSQVPDSYEMPRNTLDINITKKLSKTVELRASVKDILSEDVVYKQFPAFVKDGVKQEREQTTRKYNPGQSVSIGVSIKL